MLDQYAYLIGDLIIAIPFGLLYLWKPKQRGEMLLVGAVVGALALLTSSTFMRDYWRPEFMLGGQFRLEEFLYGFFVGGLAAVIYTAGTRSKLRPVRAKRTPLKAVVMTLGIALMVFTGATWWMGLSSIYSAIFILIGLTILIYAKRHDLLVVSLVSGVATALITLIGFWLLLLIYPTLISEWWYMGALSGVFILGVPVEELYWAFMLGAAAGPAYELYRGLVYTPVKTSAKKGAVQRLR